MSKEMTAKDWYALPEECKYLCWVKLPQTDTFFQVKNATTEVYLKPFKLIFHVSVNLKEKTFTLLEDGIIQFDYGRVIVWDRYKCRSCGESFQKAIDRTIVFDPDTSKIYQNYIFEKRKDTTHKCGRFSFGRAEHVGIEVNPSYVHEDDD